jgi:hypothetical protein
MRVNFRDGWESRVRFCSLVPRPQGSVNDVDTLNSVCLVKRSRALLGSNLTRDNQVRVTENRRQALSETMGLFSWLFFPPLKIFLEPSMPSKIQSAFPCRNPLSDRRPATPETAGWMSRDGRSGDERPWHGVFRRQWAWVRSAASA